MTEMYRMYCNESLHERSSAGHTLRKNVQRVKIPEYDSANPEMKPRTLDRTREESETKGSPRLTKPVQTGNK